MAALFQIHGPERTTAAVIDFGTEIDGVQYTLRLEWLHYVQFWILSVGDVAGVQVVDGIRVVANFNMLYPYSDSRLPPGNIICHDTQNLRQPPGRNDWRARHILLFAPTRVTDTGLDTVSGAVVVP